MAKQIYMTNDDVENIVEKVSTELRNNFSGLKCYGSIDMAISSSISATAQKNSLMRFMSITTMAKCRR